MLFACCLLLRWLCALNILSDFISIFFKDDKSGGFWPTKKSVRTSLPLYYTEFRSLYTLLVLCYATTGLILHHHTCDTLSGTLIDVKAFR